MSGDIRIIHGDCLSVLPTLEAGSVDAIVTDPPYHRVKSEAWDNQWGSDDSYLEWLGRIADEWCRVLSPAGSLYVFASPRMAARVEMLIASRFAVVNAITWQKDFPCGALKYGAENFRGYVEMSERIVFAEHDSEPAGKLIADACELQGVTYRDLARLFPSRTGGLTGCVSNWRSGANLPSSEQWQAMSKLLNLPSYDEFLAIHDRLKRPFFAREDAPHTDVWTFKPVSQAKLVHPCEKPLPLLKHILNTSTREGDTVLDCFAGSGSTLVACMKTGRKGIGIECEAKYIPTIERRCRAAETPLFTEAS